MKLIDFYYFFSEGGKYKIKGFKNRIGLVFYRSDGRVFIYRDEEGSKSNSEKFIYKKC